MLIMGYLQVVCRRCGKKLDSRDELKKHMDEKHGTSFWERMIRTIVS